jgi:putative membrane protein
MTMRKFPLFLLVAYLIYFLVLAINPYNRLVWIAENVPMVIIVLVLVLTYKKFQFSDTAYAFMAVLIFLHTLGGHYTFERVPLGYWLQDGFDFERNHFDRIAHFSVGLYAYAVAELVLVKGWIRSKAVLLLFAIFSILSVAAVYEVFEWQYAVLGDPTAGEAVLGSQGDRWDAQKDMLADGLGALFGTFHFWLARRKNLEKLI